MDEFKKAARSYKGRTIFVFVDTDSNESSRIMDSFGLKKGDVPTIYLLSLGKYMKKEKAELTKIDAQGIVNFLDEFFIKDLNSQKIPSDWDAQPVKILVGKNFDQVVRDTTKTVLVEFCKLSL